MADARWNPMRTYPVEGDSAVFELERGGELFAAMWLDGIDLSARVRRAPHLHGSWCASTAIPRRTTAPKPSTSTS